MCLRSFDRNLKQTHSKSSNKKNNPAFILDR
ncbi:MAG TPA: hypothetical protein DEB17_04310 [Chlorobaculum sp.]|uniref:Uncharacterized protein n=1 Tax=Chlorobaculum tepidum (strain ATCC 49652 / DSM 12025 / NBRC 103806 / TLS) TaxID=194439 RepID=Q8KAG5_CHLTE|nr:hypothetical protein CT2197 [Chlorobaculum tepidum TLS]HBU23207.1 hypothetical protein [Chlorobaculum sp.]